MNQKRLLKQRHYWYSMMIYSSVIILFNLTFIFCCLPYMVNKDIVTQWKALIPEFILQNPEIIGLISLDEHEKNHYTSFLPYFTFFIASVYVSSSLK
jgi:hypothetical protein